MKKTLSFMLAFILVMGVLFSAPITVYATSKTQAEAVAWANSKVGGSWDQDGVYGAQCVDLIKLYYVFLGVSPVLGNGCDYATNSLPSGWQRIRYYSGFVPQPGDVAVWTYTTSAYGHVAIVTSADSSRFYVVEQNGSTHVTRAHNYSYSYGTLWGFIRPNFNGTSTTPVSYNYQAITPGSYYVRSNGQSEHNYLTVSYTSADSGAAVNAWSFLTVSRVQIANNGGNFYTMKFPDITTANAVNVHTSSTYPTSTTKVTNYKYSGSSTQSWGFDKVTGGYVIRCKANENMVLTCNGSGQATISAYSVGNANQIWTLVPYVSGIVNYNANGGSGAPASQTKYFNQTLTLSNVKPTRSGYTFKGWGTSSSDTSPNYYAGSSYTSESGITLYAIWERSQTTYTVSYNANGGSGAPSSQTHTSGAAHTVTSTIPTRFGYTFVGWGTTSSATSGYLPGQTFSVTSNRTLYAIWQTAVSFSSTHQTGGYSANIIAPDHCRYYTITPSYTRKYRIESTGSIDSKVTIYNASGTELTSDDDTGNENNFSLNYTFQSGQKYYIKIHAYGEDTGSIPFTMKAIWNITYNANGGSGAPSSQEKLYGQNVYLSSTIPQRSGYTFLGWATSANATSAQYSAGATYSAESNVTLYAVWRQNAVATVPATPKVTGVNTLNGIDIKWNSIPGAVKYVVYKRLGTSSTWDIIATTTGTSFSDNNTPSAGSYYIYSVKAYNSANTPSNYEKAKTAVVQRVVAPYTKATNATNGINVTWGTVAGANKYIVLRRIGTESTWRIIGETTGTSFRDTNVNVGIYYIYSIRAVNGTGYSAYDINKRFTIQYITAPTAVATNIIDGVNISWSGVIGATKYAVYRRQGGYSTWYLVGYTQGTSIRDYDVENGIYYVYSVRAYNGSGYSAYNGSKTDTIQPVKAPGVYAWIYDDSYGVACIEWEHVTGAKKYNVYRREDGSNQWIYLTTTTDNYYYDTSIYSGTTYHYSVRAINGTGYSAYNYYMTDWVYF